MSDQPVYGDKELSKVSDPTKVSDLYGFACFVSADNGGKIPDPAPYRKRIEELSLKRLESFTERVKKILLSGEFVGANPDKSKWMNELVAKMWEDIIEKALQAERKGKDV